MSDARLSRPHALLAALVLGGLALNLLRPLLHGRRTAGVAQRSGAG